MEFLEVLGGASSNDGGGAEQRRHGQQRRDDAKRCPEDRRSLGEYTSKRISGYDHRTRTNSSNKVDELIGWDSETHLLKSPNPDSRQLNRFFCSS